MFKGVLRISPYKILNINLLNNLLLILCHEYVDYIATLSRFKLPYTYIQIRRKS